MEVKYTIKDLERLTGIKAHTIRIWEQRFNLLSPERGGRNIRSYSNEELKRLLNVNLLSQSGYKISEIASLSTQELKDKLSSISQLKFPESSDFINVLILAMIDLDEDKFNHAIKQSIAQSTFECCIEGVIFPFLRKIGIMWQAGDVNPAQEHFITNLIRQKLIAQIDLLPNNSSQNSIIGILYLPENEWHELSLLYYSYLLKFKGYRHLYLGQSVPFKDIVNIVHQLKPQFVLTIFTLPFEQITIEEYLNEMSKTLNSVPLFISGFQVMKEPIQLPVNARLFKDTKDFWEEFNNVVNAK